MPKMRAVRSLVRRVRLKSLSGRFPSPAKAGCESRCRPVAFATVIRWSKTVTGPACNTPASQAMKSSA